MLTCKVTSIALSSKQCNVGGGFKVTLVDSPHAHEGQCDSTLGDRLILAEAQACIEFVSWRRIDLEKGILARGGTVATSLLRTALHRDGRSGMKRCDAAPIVPLVARRRSQSAASLI
jgi:hypothetical protein